MGHWTVLFSDRLFVCLSLSINLPIAVLSMLRGGVPDDFGEELDSEDEQALSQAAARLELRQDHV